MLPVTHRLRHRADFARVVRHGHRSASRTVVVHRLLDPSAKHCRVGLVVSRSVGTAVVRNTVKRRLRAVIRGRLSRLAPGLLVLRATPRAGHATFAALEADVDGCLKTLERNQK